MPPSFIPLHDADGRKNEIHRVHVRHTYGWRSWYVTKPSLEEAVAHLQKVFPNAEVKPYDHSITIAQMAVKANRGRRK